MTCRSIVVCDKCGKELPIQVWGRRFNIREIKPLNVKQNEFDLCEECYGTFKEWLKVRE